MTNKVCTKCGVEKSIEFFLKNDRYKGGFTTWCKSCYKKASKNHYESNKEEINRNAILWAKRNKNKARAIQKKSKDKYKIRNAKQHRLWQQKNLDKLRKITAKRKAAKLKCTPKWADKRAIESFYKLASELQEMTGVPMHVDHIVPLQHPNVCGLHCEANLQILPGSFNSAKRNYWWPGMYADKPGLSAQLLQVQKAYDQPDMFVQQERVKPPENLELFGGGK